jgi:hypothetical protein
MMGMKKEWLTSEKPQRLRSPSHKHKLSNDPSEFMNMDEIEKCGAISSSDEVRVPKHMFEKLIKTAQQMHSPETPKKCMCKCKCGFYSSETELVAAISPAIPNPFSPCSSKSLSQGFSQMTLPEPNQLTEALLQNIPKNSQPFAMIPPPTFPTNIYNPWYMNSINSDPSTLQQLITLFFNIFITKILTDT